MQRIYFDNPLKFWDKDKIFAKITLLNPNTIIQVKTLLYHRDCMHIRISKNLISKSKKFWIKGGVGIVTVLTLVQLSWSEIMLKKKWQRLER